MSGEGPEANSDSIVLTTLQSKIKSYRFDGEGVIEHSVRFLPTRGETFVLSEPRWHSIKSRLLRLAANQCDVHRNQSNPLWLFVATHLCDKWVITIILLEPHTYRSLIFDIYLFLCQKVANSTHRTCGLSS